MAFDTPRCLSKLVLVPIAFAIDGYGCPLELHQFYTNDYTVVLQQMVWHKTSRILYTRPATIQIGSMQLLQVRPAAQGVTSRTKLGCIIRKRNTGAKGANLLRIKQTRPTNFIWQSFQIYYMLQLWYEPEKSVLKPSLQVHLPLVPKRHEMHLWWALQPFGFLVQLRSAHDQACMHCNCMHHLAIVSCIALMCCNGLSAL